MVERRGIPLFNLLFCMLAASILQPTLVACDDSYKIVCYLGSWANYRYGSGKFLIEDIDPSLCTHLIYGFAKLGPDNHIAAYDPYLDLKENWGLGAYARFNKLKQRNPGLKTLIAIGGWNEGSVKYSQMAKSSSRRKVFIDSCVDFIRRYGFDGLDMDWEYPANRGGLPEDKQNFVFLLQELKKAFEPYGFILSAAVSAGSHTIHKAYDVPSVAKYLDFINLMTYDFHGAWETVTGHNAPLYPRPSDTEDEKMLNVDYAVRLWISLGAPREKIILGMALYGRSFTLQDPTKTTIGSPVTGGGQAGPYTGERGMIGFNELCSMLQREKGWTVVINKHYKAPYAFKDSQWIGFDDIESIAAKVDYIKQMNLGGGMVWSLETDDFKGECEQFRYPLLTTIRMGLHSKSTSRPQTVAPTSSTARPQTVTPASSTTARSSPDKIPVPSTPAEEQPSVNEDIESPSLCKRTGYFRDPNDCKRFYFCTPSMYGGFDIYWYTCAPGTLFSEALQSCNFPMYIPECKTK